MIQMLDFFLHASDGLNTRATSSKNGNPFAVEIVALLIIGCMHDLAFEIRKTPDIRHLPAAEHSTSIDKELSGVLEDCATRQIANLDAPDTFLFVPMSAFNNMSQLDILANKIALLLDLFQILPDLPRVGVVMCPKLWFPGKLVVDTRYVTCTSWISVLVPCALEVSSLSSCSRSTECESKISNVHWGSS